MRTRIFTALIGIPLAVVLALSPYPLLFEIALLILAALATMEAAQLLAKKGIEPNVFCLMGGFCVLLFSLHTLMGYTLLRWAYFPHLVQSVTTLAFLCACAWELFKSTQFEDNQPVQNLTSGLLAAIIGSVSFWFPLRLYQIPIARSVNQWLDQTASVAAPADLAKQGGLHVLFLLVIVWTGDSLAYFVGRQFGKRKLAPTISPNKTVEGAIANLIGCVVAAMIYGSWLRYSLPLCVALGVVVGVAGQVGDLTESLFKRQAGVKDSGALLPGHGGVLDRFDAFLFACPLFYYLLLWFG